MADLPFDLPPILIIDQRLHQTLTSEESSASTQGSDTTANLMSELAEVVVHISSGKEDVAAHVLPRSISMEDLLTQINHALGI